MTRSVLPPAPPRASAATGLAGLLGVFAGLAAVLPAAAAPTCEILHPGRVVLQAVYPRPTLDTSLDLAALQRRVPASHARGGERGGEIGPLLGLTVPTQGDAPEADYEFAYADPREPRRGVCGVAAEIRLRFGFEGAVIYVAREIAADPCLFAEAYRHEWRHVQADRDLIAEFAPRVEANLRTLITRIGTVRGPTREAVSGEIREHIAAAFAADVAAFEHAMRERRDSIDQPAEYRRMNEVCGGAGARLINGLRRPG
jgi:hypothetical protein